MKSTIKLRLLYILTLYLISLNVDAQVSFNGVNGNPASDYCGWNNATAGQLMIKNESNNPINFLTNTGAGGTTPLWRKSDG